jgi:hypothetical protein
MYIACPIMSSLTKEVNMAEKNIGNLKLDLIVAA